MPRFEPFKGVRYRTEDGHLDDLIAPPYDVVSPADRSRLAERSAYNAVRLEVPGEEDGADRYQTAASLWRSWLDEGVLVRDPEPAFYVYRMGFKDQSGRPQQTSGVLGAVALSPLGQGDILPHEHTTPKDKSDRLQLLRACRVNLSPLWMLSTAPGLSSLCEPPAPPDARATDDEGVHHRLWRVTQPAVLEAIADAVASSPLLIADGHHRYETAQAYQQERREATGGAPGAYDWVMACVVELNEEQVAVQGTHRVLSGLDPGFDLIGALSAHFEVMPAGIPASSLVSRSEQNGTMAMVTPEGTWLLRPLESTLAAAAHDLDSSRLDVALSALPEHSLAFDNDVDRVLAAASAGQAQAVFLLRPPTVAQIAEIGRGGERMPPKTTYFHPKLRTGMVFREVPG